MLFIFGRFYKILEKYQHNFGSEGYGPVDHRDMRFLIRSGILYRLITFILTITVIYLIFWR